jgi:ABC-type branched-subunit amino acid transport system substrate-binding protein
MKSALSRLYLLTLIYAFFLAFLQPLPGWANDEKVTIGVIAPLTGAMATIGVAIKNGIELAQSDRPDLFEKVRFVFEDDQYDPKQSLAAYRKLRDLDQVSVVFGFGAVLGTILGPLADQDGVALINLNFETSPAVGRRFVVRAMNHTGQYMKAMAEHFAALKKEHFTLIQAEGQFFEAMVGSFVSAARNPDQVQILAPLNPIEMDFRASILTLKAKARANGPRTIALFLTPQQILAFLKQAGELHFEADYFGTDLFETAATTASDPAILEGCAYPDNKVNEQFREQYRSHFGSEAQLTFSGVAYEMALLMAEQFSARQEYASYKSVPHLIQRLALVQNRPGVLGNFNFSNSSATGRFFEFPIIVKVIKNGVGVPAYEAPQY